MKRQGPSGAVGHALNALGWAKSAVWSTAKEGIDLFQGEGFRVATGGIKRLLITGLGI